MSSRQLKLTILAVVSALAVSAAASSAASAGTFSAASYPAKITGEQTTQVVFTGVVGKWVCTKLATQGELNAASSALNLAPSYEGCSWAGVGATTFMEGCTYEFHAGETVEGNENKVAATMDVKCPAGKEVKLVLNGGTCTIWIPEQTGLGSVTLETTPAAKPVDLDVVLNLSKIKYKVQNGLLGCPNKPADGTYTNGTLAGTETLGAENTKGEAIAFSAF